MTTRVVPDVGRFRCRRGRRAGSVACPLPLGGLTVHSPLTLHAAGGNVSADTRRAWVLHFHAPAPLGARMRGLVRRFAARIVG